MGKGDKKTTRGKIIQGSYGKTRPRKKNKPADVVVEKVVKAKKVDAATDEKVVKKPRAKKESAAEEKPKAVKKTSKKAEE